MTEVTLQITGMHCGHCVGNRRDMLSRIIAGENLPAARAHARLARDRMSLTSVAAPYAPDAPVPRMSTERIFEIDLTSPRVALNF